MQAAYRKYPTRHNTNVKSLDTLERRSGHSSNAVSGHGQFLFSHRLFGTLWTVPTLVIKVRIQNQCIIIII